MYVFDPFSKELKTGGDVNPCLPGGFGKMLFEKMRKYAEIGLTAHVCI